MFIYPAEETVTRFRHLPWFSLALSAAAIFVYFSYYRPAQVEYQEKQLALWKAFNETIDWEVEQNKLKRDIGLQIQKDPVLLEQDNEIYQFVSDYTRQRYSMLMKNKRPLLERLDRGGIYAMLLILVCPGTVLLLLSMLGLYLGTYVIEHQYASLGAAVVYLLSGAALVVGHPYLPTDFKVAPDFFWFILVSALILTSWLRAPGAVVTVAAKGWAFKTFAKTFRVPAGVVAVSYVVLGTVICMTIVPQSELFRPQWVGLAAAAAVFWALLLMFFPTRAQIEIKDPEVVINAGLAQTELLLQAEKVDEARTKLEDLLISSPTLEQIVRVGDLAWKSNLVETSEKAYLMAFRRVLPGRKLQEILPVIEKMVFRGFAVPVSGLQIAIELGISERHVGHIKKLLRHFKDHPNVQDSQLRTVFGRLIDYETSSKEPDEEFLVEIFGWFGEYEPLAKEVEQIKNFLNERRPTDVSSQNYTSMNQIHRHVDSELLGVTNQHVRLKVKGSNPQNVPWTAIIALYGAHILGSDRGYRGCVILRFKRKMFGCHFANDDIAIYDESGERLSFENTWSMFEKFVSEGIPFLRFENFKDFVSDELYQEEVQKFLDEAFDR